MKKVHAPLGKEELAHHQLHVGTPNRCALLIRAEPRRAAQRVRDRLAVVAVRTMRGSCIADSGAGDGRAPRRFSAHFHVDINAHPMKGTQGNETHLQGQYRTVSRTTSSGAGTRCSRSIRSTSSCRHIRHATTHDTPCKRGVGRRCGSSRAAAMPRAGVRRPGLQPTPGAPSHQARILPSQARPARPAADAVLVSASPFCAVCDDRRIRHVHTAAGCPWRRQARARPTA